MIPPHISKPLNIIPMFCVYFQNPNYANNFTFISNCPDKNEPCDVICSVVPLNCLFYINCLKHLLSRLLSNTCVNIYFEIYLFEM